MSNLIKKYIKNLGWLDSDYEFIFLYERAMDASDVLTKKEVYKLIDDLQEFIPCLER